MNLKRSTVSYRPFEQQAILQDGLLAVRRPGGEEAQALANGLFSAAGVFQEQAERTALRKGQEAGAAAGRGAGVGVDIRGGERGPDSVVPRGGVGASAVVDGDVADLLVGNAGKTRDKPVTKTLEQQARRAVRKVFGKGYKVELFSGGQDALGEGDKRTGSTRHDHGKAGDWRVIGPDGKPVTGDPLGKLGQYWLANKLGGVGLEMKDGAIHLDEHTDRAKAWNYADKGGQFTPAQQKAVEAGLRGEMPNLAEAPKHSMPAIIAVSAARYGVDAGLLVKMAHIESGLNPAAKNSKSSAGGLFQQTDDNAAQYGVKDRFDPAQSADAAARFMRDNRDYLTRRLGRPVTEGELYLAHQQGAAGAERLLKDPSRKAVDALGVDQVLNNGGNADMTAGEFAALWTRKIGNAEAKDGLGAMPTVDLGGDGFDVVPGERSALTIDVRDGGLRLTGRDTIFGRAFDKASEDSYRGQLQDAMLSATDELASKYADDPAGMRDAFDLLKQRQLGEHVKPDIRADYEEAFGRLTRRHLKGAQAEHEKKIKQAEESDWLSNGTSYEEALGQAQIGLEAGDDDGMTAIAAHAQRMKQHWREGVAKGFITPKQARDAAQRLDGDVASGWYVAQAKDAKPEDIDALRQTLEADYAAGKLKGVDARGWTKIDTVLKRQAAQGRQDAAMASQKLGKIADSVLDRAALGYEISPEELNAMRGAAGAVEGGDDIVTGTLDVLDIGQLLRNEPVGAAEDKLQKMRDLFGKTPTEAEAVLLGKAEGLVKKSREALSTDLLGFAERSGVIENPGSLADVKTAEDMQTLIDNRVAAASAAATHFGVGEQYFRPGEVKALEAMVMADPDAGAAMAASILTGSGDQVGAVLKEFGNTAPVLAGAGAILAGGGDAVAARDAIAGAGKDADGKAYSVKGDRVRREAGKKAVSSALDMVRGGADRVLTTAEFIARKRISDKGLEPDGAEAEAEYNTALNEAAGAVFDKDGQWGGFADYDPGFWKDAHKVVVPSSIKADRLGDLVDAVKSEDLPVQPLGGVDVLQEQWPMWTGSGFAFVTFNSDGEPEPLLGQDGKLFVLPLQNMGNTLGKRVPGAIRGY